MAINGDIYDVTIIGAGPGGYTAAIRAAQLGGKVALVEERDIGGTCLNRGCIPTKSLLESVEAYESLREIETLGVNVQNPSINISSVIKRKNEVVMRLRSGIQALVKLNSIDLINGKGIIINNQTIEISSSTGARTIKTRKIIIATGSIPARIPVPGIEFPGVITSDEVLDLESIPEKLIIVGGGAIGVEMATIFSGLGAEVTILEMMEEILPGLDLEIVEILQKILKKKNVNVITSAKLVSIEKESTNKVVNFIRNGEKCSLPAKLVLMATGRLPNKDGLGLEKTGVIMQKGMVVVNNKMETNIPGIYAIGDVTGGILLAHVAMAEGKIAAENAMGQDAKINYKVVPSCIYTNPEVAGVGLTEKQAVEKGYDVRVGRFPMSASGRASTMNKKDGMIKIIAGKEYGEILGAFMVCPRATEMISELALAINMEATLDEILTTIHPHPTLSESVFEAAHDAKGECIHLPPKKK